MQFKIDKQVPLKKLRLTTLVSVLAFVLVGCSLSEDITPPPDYQSPTPVSTGEPVTQTPLPTWTSKPATVTPTSVPDGNEDAVPDATDLVTPSLSLVTIQGKVTMNSGSTLPADLIASLLVYDTEAGQEVQTLTTAVQPGGMYRFAKVPASSSTAYLASVEYSGVTYQSDPALYDETKSGYDLPIVLYESSDDPSTLTLSQIHVMFVPSSQNVVRVTELYIVTNPGSQALIIAGDGTRIPFFQVSEEASDIRYQPASGSSPFLPAIGGFALLPGAEKQYGILVTYTLPYDRSLKFTQPFSSPVSSLTIFIPHGMKISSKQLTDAGTQDIQGETYLIYQGESLASGSSLSLTLSGTPGTSTAIPITRQTGLLIGIGVVGLLLIGLGVYLYLRDRSRLKEEDIEEGVEGDAFGEDRDSIMDAILVLDDQHRAGEIPQEAYEKRRAELKGRLEKLIR